MANWKERNAVYFKALPRHLPERITGLLVWNRRQYIQNRKKKQTKYSLNWVLEAYREEEMNL
jgi:hypothetical protein